MRVFVLKSQRETESSAPVSTIEGVFFSLDSAKREMKKCAENMKQQFLDGLELDDEDIEVTEYDSRITVQDIVSLVEFYEVAIIEKTVEE